MKTNRIMDEIRSTISPEMKMQMEMSVAIANRIYDIHERLAPDQRYLVGISRFLFIRRSEAPGTFDGRERIHSIIVGRRMAIGYY